MSAGWTWLLLAFAIVVFFWSRHLAGRPVEPPKVRLVPYTGIAFIAVVVGLLAVIHLLGLAGIETGNPRLR